MTHKSKLQQVRQKLETTNPLSEAFVRLLEDEQVTIRMVEKEERRKKRRK